MTSIATPFPARFPASTRDDNIRFAKLVVFINALVPGAILLWDYLHHTLGANPVNFAIRTTGMLTLVFLVLTLSVTPLRKLTGFSWLFLFRRMLGLYAFFYSLTHFSIFFGLDQGWNIPHTVSEMLQRKYLLVGSAAILLMVPLAATSLNIAIKKMGPRDWKLLHRLTYVVCILGVIHFYMLQKSDKTLSEWFIAAFVLLLAYRLFAWTAAPATLAPGFPVQMAEAAPRWIGRLRIEKITEETPNVRTFRLANAAGGPLPFSYQPGQHLTLSLPIDGRLVKRSYTIASTPTRPGVCELTIKREEKGIASPAMHRLQAGDLLEVAAPAGKFTFTGQNEKGVVLLAGGVGITPLMAIVRYLTDNQWPGDIHLLYASKTENDIIFKNELEQLAGKFPNLHITHTLTRADTAWTGRRGRIDAALVKESVPAIQTLPAYICGPTEMIAASQQLLREIGLPENRIFTESFGAVVDESGATGVFTVAFTRSKKEAMVPNTRPLLLAAESLGIDIDYDCRSGICGRCKCRMTSGEVVMQNEEALTPEEKRRGLILLCQAKPVRDTVIDA